MVIAGEFVVYAYISLAVGGQVVVGDGTIATALVLFGAGSTAGTLLGGFLVDRFGWSRVLVVSMVVIGSVMPLLSLCTVWCWCVHV